MSFFVNQPRMRNLLVNGYLALPKDVSVGKAMTTLKKVQQGVNLIPSEREFVYGLVTQLLEFNINDQSNYIRFRTRMTKKTK
jgi:hypothetical protein